ncbi:Iron-sulfur assembly protein 1 [Bachmanniomyces sp. S44760]|nr:Iron-sulfur assembly protein 1 [Bachmanniomyces sp. S44760]
MSLSRCIVSKATSLSANFSFPPARICPSQTDFRHVVRCFASSRKFRLSSKRELQTATAYRPLNLDSVPPPPRNTGVPDTSIAGQIPQVNETRPPRRSTEKEPYLQPVVDEQRPESNQTEQEAQQSKPVQSSQLSQVPKPKRKLRPRKAAMSLTQTAITHLRDLLEQPEPKLIRVGVKNRGCSGLAYHLEYVDKAGSFDEAVEQDGVKVLIDSKALFSIIGSEMDWVEDKLNQRFVFRNPNIKEQCGCGESFMV